MPLLKRFSRVTLILLVVLSVMIGPTGIANAEPTTETPTTTLGTYPVNPEAVRSVAKWPIELRQFVAGTEDFNKGRWFTGPCGAKGSVGAYINEFFFYEGAFQLQLATGFFEKHPELVEPMEFEGQKPDTFPAGDTAFNMSESLCADKMAAWGIYDPKSPWGFKFVPQPDAASLELMQGYKAFGNGDWVDPADVCSDEDNGYLCSRAMYLDCSKATEETDLTLCQAWNTSVQQHLNGLSNWIESNKGFWDRVGEFFSMVGDGLWAAGTWVVQAFIWVVTLPFQIIGWLAEEGLEQVIAFLVEGAITVWSWLMQFIVYATSPNLTNGGFISTYNLISGIMMMLVFLGWCASFIVAWKRGKLAMTFLGAVKAVVGLNLVGVLALLMLKLSDEATQLLIQNFGAGIGNTDFSTALTRANPPVAVFVAVFSILSVIAALILLLFQQPMTLAHSLFGTIAVAGQVHESTHSWFGKWFMRLLSLVWMKFFMVGLMILALNIALPTAANAEEDALTSIMSLLSSLMLMISMPFTPYFLNKVMEVTVGFANGGAAALVGKLMTGAADAAVAGASGGTSHAGKGSQMSAIAGPAASAVTTMAANLKDMMTGIGGGESGADSGNVVGDKPFGKKSGSSSKTDGKAALGAGGQSEKAASGPVVGGKPFSRNKSSEQLSGNPLSGADQVSSQPASDAGSGGPTTGSESATAPLVPTDNGATAAEPTSPAGPGQPTDVAVSPGSTPGRTGPAAGVTPDGVTRGQPATGGPQKSSAAVGDAAPAGGVPAPITNPAAHGRGVAYLGSASPSSAGSTVTNGGTGQGGQVPAGNGAASSDNVAGSSAIPPVSNRSASNNFGGPSPANGSVPPSGAGAGGNSRSNEPPPDPQDEASMPPMDLDTLSPTRPTQPRPAASKPPVFTRPSDPAGSSS